MKVNAKIPFHIALIADGNRRWARSIGVTDQVGHMAGSIALSGVLFRAYDWDVHMFSVYGLSTENIKERSRKELDGVETVFSDFANELILHEYKKVEEYGMKVNWAGDRSLVRPYARRCLEELEKATKDYYKHELNLCIGYGGQDEIARAFLKMVKDLGKSNIDVLNLSSETVRNLLSLYLDIPTPVDILIRPGGDNRISNFLLWQSSYAELCFQEKYLPDLTESDIDYAITRYSITERPIGGERKKTEKKILTDLGLPGLLFGTLSDILKRRR